MSLLPPQPTPLRAGLDRFAAYLDGVSAMLGHKGRAAAMQAYCTGLLLPGGRKSTELLAARLGSGRVGALHQSLHHLVAVADWDDEGVLRAVRAEVLPVLERHGPVRYWIVDELCLPKQGGHSVGVARQRCDAADRDLNCQIAICLWVANRRTALPVATRLFLPPAWTGDQAKRARTGVPSGVPFRTKAELALGQLRQARAEGVPAGIVLGASGDALLRSGVAELGLSYVLGVPSSTLLRPAGAGAPIPAAAYVAGLPARAWRRVEQGGGAAASRHAAVRVRSEAIPSGGEWLLAEQPGTAATRCWLSNLPASATLAELVRAVRRGKHLERSRQELMEGVGLARYEGRGWRGFHHHASLCVAVYGFLLAERCLTPSRQRLSPDRLVPPELPLNFRPRGAGQR